MKDLSLNEKQIEKYHEDGFLHVPQMFGSEQMQTLVDGLSELAARRHDHPELLFLLEPLSEEQMNTLPSLQTVRKINNLQHVPEIMRFFGPEAPPARIAAQLIGDRRLRMMGLFCFAKPAGHGTATPWHQDQALWSHWLPTAVSCWVAIDQCTLENGCLQFLRGSHKEGMAPWIKTDIPQQPVSVAAEAVDPRRVVKLEMEAGDAVFFGGKVWHCSDPNRSPNRRLGMPAVYSSDIEMRESIHTGDWCNLRMQNGLQLGTTKEFYDSRPELIIRTDSM